MKRIIPCLYLLAVSALAFPVHTNTFVGAAADSAPPGYDAALWDFSGFDDQLIVADFSDVSFSNAGFRMSYPMRGTVYLDIIATSSVSIFQTNIITQTLEYFTNCYGKITSTNVYPGWSQVSNAVIIYADYYTNALSVSTSAPITFASGVASNVISTNSAAVCLVYTGNAPSVTVPAYGITTTVYAQVTNYSAYSTSIVIAADTRGSNMVKNAGFDSASTNWSFNNVSFSGGLATHAAGVTNSILAQGISGLVTGQQALVEVYCFAVSYLGGSNYYSFAGVTSSVQSGINLTRSFERITVVNPNEPFVLTYGSTGSIVYVDYVNIFPLNIGQTVSVAKTSTTNILAASNTVYAVYPETERACPLFSASTTTYQRVIVTIPRTNMPPDGLYYSEMLAYSGATNQARSVLKGQVTVSHSTYANTNMSAWTNPTANSVIGPPGHSLTPVGNWPFVSSVSVADGPTTTGTVANGLLDITVSTTAGAGATNITGSVTSVYNAATRTFSSGIASGAVGSNEMASGIGLDLFGNSPGYQTGPDVYTAISSNSQGFVLRSGDTMTGPLTISGGDLQVKAPDSSQHRLFLGDLLSGGRVTMIQASNNAVSFVVASSAEKLFQANADNVAGFGWRRTVDIGTNLPSGPTTQYVLRVFGPTLFAGPVTFSNGVDADLLDGLDSIAFLRTNQLGASSGAVTVTNTPATHGQQYTIVPNTNDGTVGYAAVSASGGGTNIPVGRVIRVDSVYGSDATGQRGNWALPFLTLTNALLAQQNGDTIAVGPGVYTMGAEVAVLSNGASIVGAGRTATRISSFATAETFRADSSNSFRGIGFTYTGSVPSNYVAISGHCRDLRVTDCKLAANTVVFQPHMTNSTAIFVGCEFEGGEMVDTGANGQTNNDHYVFQACRFYRTTQNSHSFWLRSASRSVFNGCVVSHRDADATGAFMLLNTATLDFSGGVIDMGTNTATPHITVFTNTATARVSGTVFLPRVNVSNAVNFSETPWGVTQVVQTVSSPTNWPRAVWASNSANGQISYWNHCLTNPAAAGGASATNMIVEAYQANAQTVCAGCYTNFIYDVERRDDGNIYDPTNGTIAPGARGTIHLSASAQLVVGNNKEAAVWIFRDRITSATNHEQRIATIGRVVTSTGVGTYGNLVSGSASWRVSNPTSVYWVVLYNADSSTRSTDPTIWASFPSLHIEFSPGQ